MALSMLLVVTVLPGDVMIVRTREYEGKFEGFKDGSFLFRTGDGLLMEQPRAPVKRLSLDTPRKVELLLAAKSDPESVKLVGYAHAKFTVAEKGKERTIFGMHVESIVLHQPALGLRSVNTDKPRELPPIDIAALEKRGDLTAQQLAALGRYKSARAKYTAFVKQSSLMVQSMDGENGQRREMMLNRLRLRKNDEQPIKLELKNAEAALVALFPVQESVPPGRGISGNSQGEDVVSNDGVPPEAGDKEVLLIEVRGIETTPGLSQAQLNAVRRYRVAKEQYLHMKSGAKTPGEREDVLTALRAAQADLFDAFPGLIITGGDTPKR